MKKDPLLSSLKGKQLYKIHKVVVPDLAFQNKEGEYLEDRWESRKGNFYASYIHKDGIVRSVVSGAFFPELGLVYIYNIGVLPEFREKGYASANIAHLADILDKEYKNIKTVHAMMSSEVKTNSIEKITDDVIQQINEASQSIHVEDEKAKMYGRVIGKSIQALKDNSITLELYNKIFDTPPQKFELGGRILDRIPEKQVKPLMNRGMNFNFVPSVSKDQNITEMAQKEKRKFRLNREKSLERKLNKGNIAESKAEGASASDREERRKSERVNSNQVPKLL